MKDNASTPSQDTGAARQPAPSRTSLCLDDLVPATTPRNLVNIGVVPQMFEDLGEDYQLQALCKEWHLLRKLKSTVATVLRTFPMGDSSAKPTAFQLFVDGSFHQGTAAAAWAVCVFGLVDLTWQWFGFLSDILPPALAVGPSGKVSAHIAEQWALLHAFAFAATHRTATFIGFDCTSAGGQAVGIHGSRPLSRLQCACISLLYACRSRHTPVQLHHTKSHQGHAGNEFVDTAAKAAASTNGFRSPPAKQYLVELWSSGDLEWLWCSLLTGLDTPNISTDGQIFECNSDVPATPFTPLDFLPPADQPGSATPVNQWSARFCTYNTLSLRALAQRECLDQQFHQAGIHVVCLQETRLPACARFHHCHYFGAASAACNGQLGCQVWFHSQLHLASAGSKKARWKPETLSVLHSEPRALLVTCVAGTQTYAFLSAHAPVAASGEEVLHSWWADLRSIARKVPYNALLFCGIDANARFNDGAKQPSTDDALGIPGQLLCQFADAQRLVCTALVDPSAFPIVTWTSPNGKRACLDYLLCPSEMGNNLVTRGSIPGFADMHPRDHEPLLAAVSWTLNSSVRPPRVRFDVDRMRSAEGRHQLQCIHASTPQVPWRVDVDQHAHIITRHLQTELAIHFPLQSRRPRQPTISDHTWAAIRLKRHAKRVGRRVANLLRKEILHDFLCLWKHCRRPGTVRRQRHLCMLAAQCQAQTIAAAQAYRKSARQDCAIKARSLFFEAKGKGPEALAQHMRCITKAGRRYKPLPTQPCLLERGQAAADPMLELGFHFAADENGHLCTDFSELALDNDFPARCHSVPLDRREVVSMPQLAVAFAAVHSHKAPGLSGLPPEAFSCAATAAASVYWPLYLKTTVRRQAPIIWRGGRVVPINKPQKALGTRAAWRSILLMEASTKAVCSAVRASLLQGFAAVAQPAQGGSRPGSALQLPMAYAQLTLDFLVRHGRSGGLIFFDGKAAFYSTFREVVLGKDALLSATQIEELARLVSPDPDVQDAFLAAALGPGLLQHSGVSNGLRQFLASTLSQTWFLIGDQSVFVTKTGTMPGAPLADLIFQFAFAHFLQRARQRLRELELTFVISNLGDCPQEVPSPTWMDDIAVPLEAPSAETLVPRAQQLVHAVAVELANIGIQVNTSQGKSEALLHFAGHGSKRQRHLWLVESNASFPVTLAANASSRMQIVSHYTHLGSAISFDRTPQLDIKRRAAAAREARRKIHRPILTNKFLSVEERLTMHWSLVIRRFLHGAGLWTFRLDRDFQSFTTAYLSLVRPICLSVVGIPSKGLDDDTVCAICGFPSARLLRDLELISMASAIGSNACEALTFLLLESTWLDELTAAWKRICDPDCPRSSAQLLAHWRTDPVSTSHSVRAVRRKCRLECKAARPQAIARATENLSLAFTGWVDINLSECVNTSQHQCGLCGQYCATASGLAVHQLHSHGVAASAGAAGSATLCPVCGTEYWEQHRLRDHLRKNPACLVPLIESDVDFAGRSRTSHTQLAWRPAVRVPFAQPFWATLRPAPTPDQPVVQEAYTTSILHSLASLQAALNKRHSPKEALVTLFSRVRGALSSTKCADFALVAPDHPLSSFVDLAVWLCTFSDDCGVYDGAGFRVARIRDRITLRFAKSPERSCTDPLLVALVRMLS